MAVICPCKLRNDPRKLIGEGILYFPSKLHEMLFRQMNALEKMFTKECLKGAFR